MSSVLILSEDLQKSVHIMNNLEPAKFPLLLNRIAQSLQTKSTTEQVFSDEEQEKLQNSFGIGQEDLKQLLDAITHVFRHSAYNMTKPAILQRQLVDNLKLSEEKSEVFTNVWSSSAKGIVEKLRQHSVFPSKLENITWSLNVQTASEYQQKQVVPKAVVQLGLDNNTNNSETSQENITIEFNHEELFSFYKQLENIQGQLDSLH